MTKLSTSQHPTLARVLNVVCAMILGASAVGYAVGIRPIPGPALPEAVRPPASAKEVRPSVSYDELRTWPRPITSPLDKLAQGLPRPGEPVVRTALDKQRSLALRALRRAYDGAPPLVPHPTDELSNAACLSCHDQGLVVAGHLAPPMSHEPMASCQQCHVRAASEGPAPDPGPAPDQGFVGLPSPGPGPRAYQGAPPQIPHHLALRERCASCHGLAGRPGLRTTHPERVNCVQCHVQRGLSPSQLPGVKQDPSRP